MENNQYKYTKNLLENYLNHSISYSVSNDFAPKEYSISKEGNISLKFISLLIGDPHFDTIEMVRFENSMETCNFTFIINLEKEHTYKLDYIFKLVDLLANHYGEDDHGEGVIKSLDRADIVSDHWSGRAWLSKKKYPIPVLISKFDDNQIDISFFVGIPV